MTREEIFSYIESFCQDKSVRNDRVPDARGNGYHLFKNGNLYWAWYGTLGKKPKFRLDFVARPPRETRNEIYAAIIDQLHGMGYNIKVMKSLLHIFFVPDIELVSVNEDTLKKAMREYQKFMDEDFSSVKEILQKKKYESA